MGLKLAIINLTAFLGDTKTSSVDCMARMGREELSRVISSSESGSMRIALSISSTPVYPLPALSVDAWSLHSSLLVLQKAFMHSSLEVRVRVRVRCWGKGLGF